MSTKIYLAWRIPQKQLNNFLDEIRPQVYRHMFGIVKNVMAAVKEDYIKKEQDEDLKIQIKFRPKQKPTLKKEKFIRLEKSFELLKKVARESTRSPGLDAEFALNIWHNESFYYIIPVGEEVHRIKLKLPDYVMDYSYWNNVDRPDNTKYADWEKRSKKWSEINCGVGVHGHNARRLCHSIVDMGCRYGDIEFECAMREKMRNKKHAK